MTNADDMHDLNRPPKIVRTLMLTLTIPAAIISFVVSRDVIAAGMSLCAPAISYLCTGYLSNYNFMLVGRYPYDVKDIINERYFYFIQYAYLSFFIGLLLALFSLIHDIRGIDFKKLYDISILFFIVSTFFLSISVIVRLIRR